MKKAFKIVGAAVILVVALIATGIGILAATDPNDIRDFLTAQVKEATGRELVIAGDLDLDISLTPSVVARDVTFSNASWGSRPEMVRLERLETGLSLIPLLQGDIQITKVVLIKPDILLETHRDGTGNWAFGKPSAEADTDNPAEAESGPAPIPALGRTLIEDGIFTFKDGETGEEIRVGLETLSLSNDETAQTSTVDLKGVFKNIPFAVKGTVGALVSLPSDPAVFPVDLETSVFSTAMELKGTIGQPLSGRKLALQTRISGDSLSETLNQLSKLLPQPIDLALPVLDGFRVSGALTGTPDNMTLSDLSLSLKSGNKLSVSGTGKVTGLPAAPSFAVEAKVDGNDLRLFAGLAKQKLPEGPAYTLSALVKNEGGGFQADNLALKLGGSDLTGSAAISLTGAVPALKLTLSSKLLDMEDIQAALPETGKEERSSSTKEDDGRVFPNTPLNLEALRSVNVDLTFAGEKLQLDKVAVEKLAATLKLNHGRLTLAPVQGEVSEGAFTASVSLGANRSTPALDTAFELTKLDLGALLKQLEATDLLTGSLNMSVSAKGQGKTPRALMASLNGKTEVIMDEGTIASQYVELLAADLLKALLPSGKGDGKTPINCMVSRFDIKDGLATSSGLLFDTPNMTISGGGTVDLRTEKLDIQVKPEPKEKSLISLSTAIDLGGTLKSPSVSPSTASLLKGVAGLALGAVNPVAFLAMTASAGTGDKNPCVAALDRAVSEKGKAPPPAQEKPSNPVDAVTKGVGDALKSLFGK